MLDTLALRSRQRGKAAAPPVVMVEVGDQSRKGERRTRPTAMSERVLSGTLDALSATPTTPGLAD